MMKESSIRLQNLRRVWKGMFQRFQIYTKLKAIESTSKAVKHDLFGQIWPNLGTADSKPLEYLKYPLHPNKALLMGFEILFEIHPAYCDL